MNTGSKILIVLLVEIAGAVIGMIAGGLLGILFGLILTGGDTALHGGGGFVGLLMLAGAFFGFFVGIAVGFVVIRRRKFLGGNDEEKS